MGWYIVVFLRDLHIGALHQRDEQGGSNVVILQSRYGDVALAAAKYATHRIVGKVLDESLVTDGAALHPNGDMTVIRMVGIRVV